MTGESSSRNLTPWRVDCELDDGSEHEMYVMAADNNEATYALTNHLRAERGLRPFEDGLGISYLRTRRMPEVFARVITRTADPLPPDTPTSGGTPPLPPGANT